MDCTEQWRPVVSYEGVYEISDHGRVKRVGIAQGARRGRILKTFLSNNGYLGVNLNYNRGHETRLVHRLVLEAFRGAPPTDRLHAHHRNAIRTDNRLANLEWVSRLENMQHAWDAGKRPRGEKHGMARLTKFQVLEIYRRRKTGEEGRTLALEFDISEATVCDIVAGRTWSWLTSREC